MFQQNGENLKWMILQANWNSPLEELFLGAIQFELTKAPEPR